MADTPEIAHGAIYERLHEAFRKLSKGKEDEYHQALGKITVSFARVDTGITYILESLSGMKPEIGRSLLRDMTLSQRLKKLRKLVPITISDEDTQARIMELVGRVDDERKNRNKHIHSLWYLLGQETGIRYDPKTQMKYFVTLEELDEFNTTLEELLFDLLDIEKAIDPR